MKLVGLKSMLEHAQANHYAVGAYNYCNAESVQAIIEEGCAQRSPVMLIIGPWELPLLGARTMVRLAEMAAADADVPVCLHLDHAAEISLVEECIAGGFPSVMIDASSKSFDENVRITKIVADMAHAKGITVEGELGAIGRTDDVTPEGEGGARLADPEECARFVELTGVDALAVAIGNAHGIYQQLPELELDLLQRIREATGVPLVLHGGSGTPADQLHRAIDIGISKVNVASELGRAFQKTISEGYEKKMWYAHSLLEAKGAIRKVVGRWMNELGSAGKVG